VSSFDFAERVSIRMGDIKSAIRVRRTRSERDLFAVTEPRWRFTSVAFSPDARMLTATGKGKPTLGLWEVLTGKQIQGYGDETNEAFWSAFSPDGSRLGSGMLDGTVRFWDQAPHDWKAPPHADASDLEAWWKDLQGNIVPAYRAIWSLAALPRAAVPFLKSKLPAVPPDAQRLTQIIADLDGKDINTREAAFTELARLGALIGPALRKSAKAPHSQEVQDRLAKLLYGLGEDLPEGETVPGLVQTPEALALMRSIWVLEKIGTPDARSILQGLTKGDPNARAVRESAAALRRLEHTQPAQ
jgi:hypothetical protein